MQFGDSSVSFHRPSSWDQRFKAHTRGLARVLSFVNAVPRMYGLV
jgi:hypothetical protein